MSRKLEDYSCCPMPRRACAPECGGASVKGEECVGVSLTPSRESLKRLQEKFLFIFHNALGFMSKADSVPWNLLSVTSHIGYAGPRASALHH